MEFHGIYTPIVTPFDEKEAIDYGKLKHNLELWGKTDLEGIVVLGSNGEFSYLSMEEKLKLVEYVVSHFNKHKKIIAGTSCESTSETIRLSQKMAALGVDAVLLLPPHYYKGAMKEDVLYQYFTDVADTCPVPVMLYNMPGNTGINLSSDLTVRLAKHPNIAGVKDTGGSIVQIAESVRDAGTEFSVFAGNAGYLFPALVSGARGATLALANILPEECCKLASLVQHNQFAQAKALQQRLLKINALVTTTYGIPGLKAALDMLGYEGGLPRRPLLPASQEAKNAIRAELEQLKKI